jgi:eukaryotic-like serine/threonine-protein kinase
VPDPAAKTVLTIARAGETWQEVRRFLDAYLAARELSGPAARLGNFLPADHAAFRRMVLIELIKLDLDYRWRLRKEQPACEEYLREYPELMADGIPCDVIYEEFHVRKRIGQAVEPEEFFQRFPQLTVELRALLNKAPDVTSSLHTSQSVPDLQPGQQLDEFELKKHLGAGAFATVFLARQRSMQRLVALKVSSSHGAESQTLAQLDHPNIVRVYDQRQLPETGLTLLYMQYVPGGTLQSILERLVQTPPKAQTGRLLIEVIDATLNARDELPPSESALRQQLSAMSWPAVVCWLGARLADALGYAHRQGVLHRDVKPANVLLTAEGWPRLADFNVGCCSKLEGASPASYFGGSLGYMSLEQLEAFSPLHPRPVESLDGRCDLYALGVMLWELLTGKRPFADLAMTGAWTVVIEQLMAQRRAGPDRTVAPLPADSPVGLEEVLLHCLAPQPEQRIATGRDLAAELELCLKPRARRLLYPPANGWCSRVRRHPIAAVLLIGLAANILMAVYNFVFNAQEIIVWMKDAEKTFYLIQGLINGVAFPIGITFFAISAWPLRQGLRRLGEGKILSPEEKRSLRRHSLLPGLRLATIGVICWLLAGLAYPLTLLATLGQAPVWVFLNFLASLTLCGLIAATYPFFGGTFLAVRAFYPALVQPGSGDESDLRDLQRIDQWISVYLVVASAVPLLAMTVLSVVRVGSPLLVGLLGIGGLVGFVGVYFLSRVIRGDLDTLRDIVKRPA